MPPLLLVPFSSLILTLFFYGLGGWFFYHNVAKKLPEYVRAKRMIRRIIEPDMKILTIEINTYGDIIKKETNLVSKSIVRNLLYIKLLGKDIALLSSGLKKEKNKDKRNVIARLLASQLYEFYQDINNLYDKKFQREVVQLLSEQMVDALKGIKKMTGTGGTQFFIKLQTIRMNVSSHRDFDTGKQVELINEINPKEIIEIANFAMLMIYFFNIFHVSFTAKVLIKLNQKVPDIPMFKNVEKDMKLWKVYSDYITSKKK